MRTTKIGLFFLGLLFGLIFVPASLYLYIRSGAAPVATSEASLPFEHFLAKTALHARMDREFPKSVPFTPDENAWMAGVRVYRENCAVCHGIPNHPRTTIAAGMFPVAPQLFEGKGMITDDPPGETFWKAKNGIRLSGMPGFDKSLSDDQLWDVSMLLAAADKLPNRVFQALADEQSNPAHGLNGGQVSGK
jgi:thiosulfate dehydrogenase